MDDSKLATDIWMSIWIETVDWCNGKNKSSESGISLRFNEFFFNEEFIWQRLSPMYYKRVFTLVCFNPGPVGPRWLG